MSNDESKGMKDVNLDEAVPEQFQGGFVQKEVFLDPQPDMVIHDLKKNNFDRWTAKVAAVGQSPKEGLWLNLGSHNINELRELFGPVPKNWIGKVVKITGKEFDQDIRDRETGKTKRARGVTLTIEAGLVQG